MTGRRQDLSPIVFINIGWMKRYAGQTDDDPLRPGNFRYLKTKGAVGHEQWNFLGKDGVVHGYVPNSSGIGISRLGASRRDEEMAGVLVVFIARDPQVNLLKVVGWYRNATAARRAKFTTRFAGTLVEAPVVAKQSDAFVIPVAEREIVVPTAGREPGGVGQSPIWYADNHPHIVTKVRALVASEGRGRKRARNPLLRSARNLDPETRKKVELAAMDRAMKYFDDAEDVSRLCRGWDIEARAGGRKILIEAKGLSGTDVSFELTPNEYKKMYEHSANYIFFVVAKALSKSPVVMVFRYRDDGPMKSAWVSDCGKRLSLKEKTGAVASCR